MYSYVDTEYVLLYVGIVIVEYDVVVIGGAQLVDRVT